MPLNLHPSVHIIDSTKLESYRTCPSRYFFEHVCGWRAETSVDLVYGSAMHALMEYLLNNGYSEESRLAGLNEFDRIYREQFSEETDDIFISKNPAVARLTAMEYLAQYPADEFNVIYTEIGGNVLVSPTRSMAFKLDALVSTTDPYSGEIKYWALEHKTTASGAGITPDWELKWHLRYQIKLYLHALRVLLLKEELPVTAMGGLIVNGIFAKSLKTKPTKIELTRVEIPYNYEMQMAFLRDLNAWLDKLYYDFELLENDDPACFASNGESPCFSYGRRCPFFSICQAFPNRIEAAKQNPLGYEPSFWNPLEMESIKVHVNLSLGV